MSNVVHVWLRRWAKWKGFWWCENKTRKSLDAGVILLKKLISPKGVTRAHTVTLPAKCETLNSFDQLTEAIIETDLWGK